MSQQNAAITVRGVDKKFGNVHIIQDLNLTIEKGERHALIGPNGAGKSTTFNLISGYITPTNGEVLLGEESIAGLPPYQINRLGLSRSFQVTNLLPRMTVWENIRCSVLWPLGKKYNFWRNIVKLKDVTERAEEILEHIGLAHRRNVTAGLLSYSEQRALEVGITTAGNPDVVMLDEPTAGMNTGETAHTVQLIRRLTEGRTLVMIEHDMSVVFGLADRISCLVYGHIIATGTPEQIRNDPKVKEAYLGEEAA